MTSFLHGGHVRLGVNFMSWSNFCVLVWLSLPWRYFITLVILFGYAVTWWMTSSLYGGHVNLGMIFLRLGWNFRLGGIFFDLVSFYTLVRSTETWYDFLRLGKFFVLVRFCLIWCCFISWCDQRHLGMISFRLGVILSDLVSFRILVRITKSWCGFCVLGGDIFLYIRFYSCMDIFNFTHVSKTSCTQIKPVLG